MQQMKKIAEFKELTGNPAHPSIALAVQTAEDVCKAKILAYLKTGTVTGQSEEYFEDVITGAKIANIPTYYTDGEYEWSTAEIYYTEKYNLTLSKEFLLKIGIDGKEKHRRRYRYRDEWK